MIKNTEQPLIHIEHVPLRPRGNGITDTMRRLKVGESFLLPNGSGRQAAYKARDAARIQIAVRHEGKGYRVWRIA